MIDNNPTVSELFKLYSQDIYRYALSLLKCEEEAKDALQETFLRYTLNKDRFRGDASPKTILLVITRNYCLSNLKRAQIRNRNIEDDDEFPDDLPNLDTKITVNDALKMLTQTQAELLFLKVHENYSYAEIAEITAQSIESVGIKLFRIRNLLKKIIKE